jgi:hypothetical protein
MGCSYRSWLFILVAFTRVLWGQAYLDKMSLVNRIAAAEVVRKPDFTFQTKTQPARVRLTTMEKLFDHPRLAAAMWRECQFVPKLYAFPLPNRGMVIDDAMGLRGTLTLAYREPGVRVYQIDGRVEKWRMGNPFAVGAKMVVVYKYWEDAQGFHSQLQTWTTLDSAILGAITRPFRKYIQRRQEEFIAYIMGNMASGGEFAEAHADDFLGPLKRGGDTLAVKQYLEVFKR